MRTSLFVSALALAACATTQPVQTLGDAESVSDAEPAVTAEPAVQPTDVLEAVTAPPIQSQSREARFAAWKRDFSNRAIARGYEPALVASTIGSAEYYERTLERDSSQPEFVKPVWDYIDNAAAPSRITRGKAEMAEHAAQIQAIENSYRVPGDILGAIWGLESSYGRIMGNFDLFDTLATLAFDGRRRDFAEQQMLAALDLIRDGKIRRDQTKSAWAGAMGMMQFIPTTFRDYAVDFDRDGNTDLWTNEADALASAAHYLARSGWRAGEPVLREVTVPDGFDWMLSETERMSVNDWNALGVRPMGAAAWPAELGFLDARLLAPGGHTGPKMLAFKNFDVLMRYNRSTSYVMGIASLAGALSDEPLIRTPWPANDQGLTQEDKIALQTALTAQGYDTQGVDGQIGPNSRRAIRAWQTANGLPADGYVEQRLLRRILSASR